MANNVNTVINIALAEEGYLEKQSNSQLDSKTANAGSGNWTKYARDLDNIPGFYNGKKNGYAWCDVFVDWCFVQAYGVEEAKKLLCQPNKSLGAGCTYSAKYYKQKGQLYKTPKVGDQIFFGSESESTHTGLVYKVDSNRVYTIEGNTSGASGVIPNGGGVCRKSYPLGSSYIYAYGRPNYDGTSSTKEVTNTPATPSKPTVNGGKCEVILNELSKGSEGAQVKSAQLLLIGNGFSCGKYGADGEFGSGTLSAVRNFQRKHNLTVDGIIGANTWSKLLRG